MKVIQDVHQIDGELRLPPPSAAHVWKKNKWVLDLNKQAELIDEEFRQLYLMIDGAADTARRSVVGDPLRAVEYERAANEARSFKSGGYSSDAVPRSVAAWAIGARTTREAADDILRESDAYLEVLSRLRETRLQAKEDLRSLRLKNDTATARTLAEKTVVDIQHIAGGVGNAR